MSGVSGKMSIVRSYEREFKSTVIKLALALALNPSLTP
jgi:hypothetical protein